MLRLVNNGMAVCFTALFASAMLISVTNCSCTYAESERPTEGSIKIGADKPAKPASTAAMDQAAFSTIFRDVAKKVVPHVVSVIPTKIDTVTFYKNPFYYFFDQGPLERFFDRGGQERGGRQKPPVEKRERRRSGMGSGVIVSEEGYILTNYHVVQGADEIEVRLKDKRTFEATIVGSDSLSDVAVIKLKGQVDDLPVAYLGNSDSLHPGDWVVAVGNPFNLSWTVTSGIVSALGRSVRGANKYEDYIQTDAAINPGNSGGALTNLDGEVIGINTLIYSRTGGSMGIGFAIPINMAKRVMQDLIYKGKVTRGWIGVTIQPVSDAMSEAMGLEGVRGVLIGDVFDGQPADKAGIKRGDVIISINGTEVNSPNDLRNVVAAIEPGTKTTFTVVREGKEKTVEVTVVERSSEMVQRVGKAQDKRPGDVEAEKEELIGITVANLTNTIRQEHDIDPKVKGIVVTDVSASSSAYGNLAPGDVIQAMKVAGSQLKSVESVEDYAQLASRVDEGDAVMFSVVRDGNKLFVAYKAN
ncbi:MAG: Do family serine endopeptidase [Chitinivibrionales bacterium]|nr:Do family serine endopeptidase [Chitinivibrionales bacterium]